jgi:hypothetical protein
MVNFEGYTVPESYEGELKDLLAGVDPYYWRAIACGLAYLAQDYGNKAGHKIDSWFTAIYGTVMEMEEVMDARVERYACDCAIADNQIDFSELEAKND